MRSDQRRRGRLFRWGMTGVALLGVLILSIDDWSRDFVRYRAEMTMDADDRTLRPLQRGESATDLEVAIRWAARRVRNVEYVGDTRDGNTTLIYLVRTNRLLRTKDDIVMRVEDRGDLRVISGSSESRLHLGDLGRNPRNLRRLRFELLDVLDGSILGRMATDYPRGQ